MIGCALVETAKSTIPCKVCGGKSTPFDVVDFLKYCSQEDFYSFGFSGVRVDYYRCSICGAIFTTFFDRWTQQDFAANVYNADYIKIDSEYQSIRPRFVANDMAKRWGDCRDARILDYGSGAGAFADELRTLGYNHVEAYDPFSSPARPSGSFDIVTCLEVIEHTPWPVESLREMVGYLKPDGCIIVSQTLQPPDILRQRGNWWYLAPRNGHICTFTADAMACLAQQCGLTFHFGPGPYAFSRPVHSDFAKRALATMGRAHHFMPLFAPSAAVPREQVDRSQWHKAELVDAGVFRWTGSANLAWPAPPMPHMPATLRLMLPFTDRIAPEMLEGVTASLGWRSTRFHRQGDSLIADLVVKRPPELIKVRTRDPISPRALKGADDDRKLGIAILAPPDSPIPDPDDDAPPDGPRDRVSAAVNPPVSRA